MDGKSKSTTAQEMEAEALRLLAAVCVLRHDGIVDLIQVRLYAGGSVVEQIDSPPDPSR